MLTLPTRAKYVESSITSCAYGNKLVSEITEAMLHSRANGQNQVAFTFDPNSLSDPFHRNINSLFIEYVKLKKYKVVNVSTESFTVTLL